MHDSSTEANYRPVEVRRPPFRHRYEVFSPKLERHITLYCWDAVLVRTLIEGIAQIDRFCERPGLLREGDAWQLVDFWVPHTGQSEYWLLANIHLPIIGAAPCIDSDRAKYTLHHPLTPATTCRVDSQLAERPPLRHLESPLD